MVSFDSAINCRHFTLIVTIPIVSSVLIINFEIFTRLPGFHYFYRQWVVVDALMLTNMSIGSTCLILRAHHIVVVENEHCSW